MKAAWLEEIEGEWEPAAPDPEQPNARPAHWLPVVLSRLEVSELLGAPGLDPLERLALRTLYATGMRATELVGLRPEALDVERGAIRLAERLVVPDRETLAGLAALDWSGAGPGWTLRSLREMLGRAARGSGVAGRYKAMGRKLLPRALRHAFGAHCLENGMDLLTLNRLLGHPYMDITEMLLELAVGLWRPAYQRCHPLATGRLRGGGRQAALKMDEVALMVRATGEPMHDLLLRTIYAAGLRVSEATGLLHADLWLDEGRLFIRDAKESKDRYTLIDAGTAEWLYEHMKGSRPEAVVFPVSERQVNRIVKKAAQSCGFLERFEARGETLSPHTFRHAHASHMYAQGMDLPTIKKLLGHSELDATVLYIEHGLTESQAAYGRSHELVLGAPLDRGYHPRFPVVDEARLRAPERLKPSGARARLR